MEKFSYALEFYYRKIFDLKNVDLFSKKVNEATKVENYFSKKILNLEYLREYIIKSYLFKPELEEVDPKLIEKWYSGVKLRLLLLSYFTPRVERNFRFLMNSISAYALAVMVTF